MADRAPLVPAPLLVVGGAALWGSTGTAQALGPEASAPLEVGALRIVVGAAALLAALVVLGRRDEAVRVVREGPRAVTLLAGTAIAAYQVLFFAGVDATGVAVGTLVGIASAPIVTGALAAVLGRPPTGRWIVGTAVTVAGSALLVLQGQRADVDPLGVLLAVGAGAAYAVYTLASKRLLDAGHAPLATIATTWLLGAGMSVPLLVGADLGWVATVGGVAMVAWLGLVTAAVGYVLYARGLQRLSAPVVASLTLAEPLTATLLALGVLGERLTAGAVAGVGLVAAGLVVVSVRPAVGARPEG